MAKEMTNEQAEQELEKGYAEAEKILNNEEKLDKFFDDLSKKIKNVPVVGNVFSNVPTLATLIRSYVNGSYKEIPTGTILALISALAYFILPIDVVADIIPMVGLLDDAAVLTACLAMCQTDVDAFVEWKHKQDGINLIEDIGQIDDFEINDFNDSENRDL